MPIGEKSISKSVGILLAVPTILLIAGGVFFFTKSDSTNHPEPSALAAAVLTLKQDIVALKSQEANVAARAWSTYQLGLTTELKGDGEFAANNFEAARQAYLEAIFNFKKSLETPQEMTLEKPPAEHSQPTSTTVRDRDEEETIKAQARKVYAKVISEERARLARVEKENVPVPPPANAAPVTVTKDTLAVLRHEAEAAKISMAAAKMKVDPESQGEALFQEAAKIEVKAQVAFAENNFEQAGRLYNLAEEQYLNVMRQVTRTRLQEKERADAVQREVRGLIGNYQAAFDRRNAPGLKALFESGFTSDDEKAWTKFFQSVQGLKTNISGGNGQIDGDHVEVSLAVRIDYANHKGIKQNPLTFQERWTLAERNGKWMVVSRQVR